jgi:hypothetical protein
MESMIFAAYKWWKSKKEHKKLLSILEAQKSVWGFVDESLAAEMALAKCESDWHKDRFILQSEVFVAAVVFIMILVHFIK